MAPVRGYLYPRTASGTSSLIPSPPWYYSGDLLTVEYRTDPARVAELLPDPLEPASEDPGAVAIIWADWQSCSQTREELLDPAEAVGDRALVARTIAKVALAHPPAPGPAAGFAGSGVVQRVEALLGTPPGRNTVTGPLLLLSHGGVTGALAGATLHLDHALAAWLLPLLAVR